MIGEAVLEINNLCIEDHDKNKLLDNISLRLREGEALGITGSSGSGKTTLIKSILGMLGEDVKVVSGCIMADNVNLSSLKGSKRRDINGRYIGYIPQNPMTAFDRRLKIGKQMIDCFKKRLNMTKSQAEKLSVVQLVKVNLKDYKRVMDSYPHELSGGMLQRVCTAIILGLSPKFILADEPTSALDEENRKMLIEIMKKDLKRRGILFISHDIEALKNLTRNVIVLGKGRVIEEGSIYDILYKPQEKWTKEFAALNSADTWEDFEWKVC